MNVHQTLTFETVSKLTRLSNRAVDLPYFFLYNNLKGVAMQVRADQIKDGGVACGCGRSPTGKCIGWHGLSEDMYQHKKMLWIEEQFRKDQEAKEEKK